MKQAKMIDKHVRARRADSRDAEVGRRVRSRRGFWSTCVVVPRSCTRPSCRKHTSSAIALANAVPRPATGDWLLGKVRIYDATMNLVRNQPELVALAGVTPQQLTLAKVDPTQLDYWTLQQRIAQLEAAGRPADEARAGLAHKISAPLSTLLMPLLAAVAAFGLARSGQVLVRATLGMALGFAYFVADNFSLAMGNAGAYPPVIAAWAPFLLFLLIGETVLVRTEE